MKEMRLDYALLASSAPLIKALIRHNAFNALPFHMPGHKMGRGFSRRFLNNIAKFDLTEIPGLDDLSFPQGPIKEAQDRAALLWGAKETFFLTGGASEGIHASIRAFLKQGDKVIISAGCHKSVINSIIINNLIPVFTTPYYNEEFQIYGAVDISSLENAMKQNTDAHVVFITSPTYYGVCSEINKISQLVHSYGRILIVDEAHGAHLGFYKGVPQSSIKQGADVCIQSAHKTLPAFTQAAYLHVGGSIVDVKKIEDALRLMRTSSPSYIIMASLDYARVFMEYYGERRLNGIISAVDELNGRIIQGGLYKVLDRKHAAPGEIDPSRIVVNFKNVGITGYEAEKILLEKYGIGIEFSDYYNIVCIVTVADSKRHIDRLAAALEDIGKKYYKPDGLKKMNTYRLFSHTASMGLKEAFYSEGENIALSDAEGRVSKNMITPYPPGIPVLIPGEVIEKKHIQYIYDIIESGAKVNGISQDLRIMVI